METTRDLTSLTTLARGLRPNPILVFRVPKSARTHRPPPRDKGGKVVWRGETERADGVNNACGGPTDPPPAVSVSAILLQL